MEWRPSRALSPFSALRPSAGWRLVLILLLGISAIYAMHYLDRGWVPHDEGTLAHSAERVLEGELPHRDFAGVYTGGLSYLNAVAFSVFGTNLVSLRLVLFAVFLAWVPAVYYIASRFVSPLPAAGVVLLAVIWSLPNYSAAVPSWYNLFSAVFGVAAVFRYLETRRRRWLVAAGVFGGLSFLAKVVGLYYIAGVLLFLIFREQSTTLSAEGSSRRRHRGYSVFISLGLLTFVFSLFTLVNSRLGRGEFTHFVLPGATLAALLFWNEWRILRRESRERFLTFWRLTAPFLMGVALPILVFLIPYVTSGAVDDLVSGVFVAPSKRLGFAAMRPPSLELSILCSLFLVLLLGGTYRHRRPRWYHVAAVVLVLSTLVIFAPQNSLVYQLVWYSIRVVVPTVVLAGAVMLVVFVRSGKKPITLRHEQIFLLLSVMALHSIVQFPFSAPVYFLYVAPMAALAALALISTQERASNFLPVSLLCFYSIFGVLWVNTGFIYKMGWSYEPDQQTQLLDLGRGGLRVSRSDKDQYELLVKVLNERSAGEFVYATPDCPEVYFLANRRNPTATFFEFFDGSRSQARRVLDTLERKGVTAVVVNTSPSFSPPIAESLSTELVKRFPQAVRVGQFVVRWKR